MNGESGGRARDVRRPRRVRLALVALLAHPQCDADRRDHGSDGAEDEHEGDTAELRRPERADRRAEQQATHLCRTVQPEGLAAPVRGRRVGQESARGRVIDRGTKTRSGAQQDEGQWPGQHERQRPEHAAWRRGR